MDINIKSRKDLVEGFLNFSEYIIEYPKISSDHKTEVARHVISKEDAVGVLLFDPQRESFILVKQLRWPAHLNLFPDQKNGVLPEVVAGNIDEGETPETAARREVTEETGYVIEDIKLFGQYFASPGYSTEKLFLYFAEVTPEIRASRITPSLDTTEDLKVVEWSLEEAQKKMEEGAIYDMKSHLSFLWYFSQKNKT